MEHTYITRQPVVNKQGKVIALRLNITVRPEMGLRDAVDCLQKIDEFWPVTSPLLFLGVQGEPLAPALFDWMPPENTAFEIPAANFAGEGAEDRATTARDSGVTFMLLCDENMQAAFNARVKFRYIGFDSRRITPAVMQSLSIKLEQVGVPIALNVDTQDSLKACFGAGVSAVSGNFYRQNAAPLGNALAPGHSSLIRTLNLVRNNADIAQIEEALKQDVGLSYKLLRYINSAGFGLSCEIQSFRHAVTMLGYEKLNKWLSLLLVSASKDPMAPALVHASLVRARTMELLGQGLIAKSELDNLFITGAFSLLDALLGVSIETAIEAMKLPEPVVDALVSHQGLYASFYDLALALEDWDGAKVADLAAALGLTSNQVNSAHMQAITFATNLG